MEMERRKGELEFDFDSRFRGIEARRVCMSVYLAAVIYM